MPTVLRHGHLRVYFFGHEPNEPPTSTSITTTPAPKWELCAGGYGLHWPDLDEDLSAEGLLRGAPAMR
jgi:hypothetical protein